jgi:DNA-binding XRE family transcriptional regulator
MFMSESICFRVNKGSQQERAMERLHRIEVAHVFGRVLKELRIESGITQEVLAERSECDRTYPSLLERGQRTPSLDVIFKLAEGLKIDPARLVRLLQERISEGR